MEKNNLLTYLVGLTQDVTVDDDDNFNFDPTAPALEDESPYPEVRSAVANTDDPTMLSCTLRAWVVGLLWAVLIPGLNQFLLFRYPHVEINQVCGFSPQRSASLLVSQLLNQILRDKLFPLLLSLPICNAWARYLPNISIFGIPLNPGPFTIKEHVIITIMAGVGAGPAYAVSVAPTWQIMSGFYPISYNHLQTEIIAVQKFFYNQHPPFACEFWGTFSPPFGLFTNEKKTDQWLLVMSTQLIGFSIGGICKRFVVAPPSMIWPDNLVTAVLFNALHGRETSGTKTHGGISRLRFFYYVFIAYIFYSQFFLPCFCAAVLVQVYYYS